METETERLKERKIRMRLVAYLLVFLACWLLVPAVDVCAAFEVGKPLWYFLLFAYLSFSLPIIGFFNSLIYGSHKHILKVATGLLKRYKCCIWKRNDASSDYYNGINENGAILNPDSVSHYF